MKNQDEKVLDFIKTNPNTNITEIRKTLNVGFYKICKILKDNNLVLGRKNKLIDKIKTYFLVENNNKKTISVICKELGVCHKTLSKYTKELNIKLESSNIRTFFKSINNQIEGKENGNK